MFFLWTADKRLTETWDPVMSLTAYFHGGLIN